MTESTEFISTKLFYKKAVFGGKKTKSHFNEHFGIFGEWPNTSLILRYTEYT